MERIKKNGRLLDKKVCEIFPEHGPTEVRIYESYADAVKWFSGVDFTELNENDLDSADINIIPIFYRPSGMFEKPKPSIGWAVQKDYGNEFFLETLFEGIYRINHRHPLNPKYFVFGSKWLKDEYKIWYNNLADSEKFQMYYDNLPPGAYLN